VTDDLFGDSAPDIYPYVGHLLSLNLEEEAQDRVKPLDPQALQAQYLAALRQVLQELAARQPLGLIFEDIHWADPSSIDLTINLLPLTSEAPILFCFVTRPEQDVPGWKLVSTAREQMGSSLTELDLRTLSDAGSQQLIANLLETETLPDRVRNLILERAEGNPLYVEEVIRMLIDRQVVTQEDSRWVVQKETESVEIPDSLHGLLLARIDRLSDDAKHALRVASVIGRQFSARVLDEVLVGEQNVRLGFLDESQQRPGIMTTKHHLTYLESSGLLRLAQTHPEAEYLFRHALMQEAAYESLLLADRQTLHRQVGQTLERLYPERLEELAPLLGQHFARAGEAQKAIRYLLQAGDQARALYAHREAIDTYRRALTFLREAGDYERAARTLMKLGLTYHNAFDFEKASQAYQEGFSLWQKTEEVESATLPVAPHPLRLAWVEPETLDPGLSHTTFDDAIISQLFSGLVSESSEMEVVPEVAQRWEVRDAGRKYIFHLGDETRWSDGVPLTAADFEYAWKRVLDPATESPKAPLLYDVKGAQAFHQGQISDSGHVKVYAPDEVTLVVELEEPASYFLHLLAQSGAFPVPRHTLEVHGETWTTMEKIVTNGPFLLETWKRGELMVLSRNPAHPGRIRGNVQKVALAFVQDSVDLSTRLLGMYEADHLDIVGLEPRTVALGSARQQYAAEYMSSPILRTTYLGFNVSQAPFDNPQVRLALAMALNLDKFVDLRVFFPANGGFVPSGMPGHSPGLHLPFQPDQARQLLAEAGYPEGQAFPVVEGFTAEGGWERIGQNLRDQWRENLGVEVKWTIMDPPAFHSMLNEESPAVFISGWVADYPDPDTFLRANPIRKFTGWQNEVYDQLVEEARRVPDQRRRMALYRQAEEVMVEDAAIIPLAYSRDEWLVKPWVKKYPILAASWWLWKDVIIEPHS
jgi:oligopeptide transport system substrate-binding protein